MSRCLLMLSCLWLCSSVVAADQNDWPAPVGRVSLETSAAASSEALLDVGLVIFDAGIPEDVSTHSKLGIFPDIRRIEAQYIPVLLRQSLIDSNAWGVVRVLPQSSELTEVLVTGQIIHSDGLRLVLHVRASDATGRLWLDEIYVDHSEAGDYPVSEEGEPYDDIYRQITNDLLARREPLVQKELREIRNVAFMRYAQSLAPEAFEGYLAGGSEKHGEERYSLNRLPAKDDPMLGRVERIRNQEYLFVDNLDEQYLQLQQEMAPTYHLWRQYDQEQALYREDYQRRASSRDSRGRRGSFTAMEQAYTQYKLSKIQQQDLRELAQGFNNEVAPTVMEADGRVFRLSGTLDSQYEDWRRILRDIFVLETDTPSGT